MLLARRQRQQDDDLQVPIERCKLPHCLATLGYPRRGALQRKVQGWRSAPVLGNVLNRWHLDRRFSLPPIGNISHPRLRPLASLEDRPYRSDPVHLSVRGLAKFFTEDIWIDLLIANRGARFRRRLPG